MDFSKVVVIDDTCFSDMSNIRDKFKNIPDNLKYFYDNKNFNYGSLELYETIPNKYIDPKKNFKYIKGGKSETSGLLIPLNSIMIQTRNQFSIGIWIDTSNTNLLLERESQRIFYNIFGEYVEFKKFFNNINYRHTIDYNIQNDTGDDRARIHVEKKHHTHLAIIKDFDKVSFFINGSVVYRIELRHNETLPYEDYYFEDSSILKNLYDNGEYSTLGFNNFVYVKDKALYYNDFELKNNMFDQYVNGIDNSILLADENVSFYSFEKNLVQINQSDKNVYKKMSSSLNFEYSELIDKIDYIIEGKEKHEYNFEDININSIEDKMDNIFFAEKLTDSINSNNYFYTNKELKFESPENNEVKAFLKEKNHYLGFQIPKMLKLTNKNFTISLDVFFKPVNDTIGLLSSDNQYKSSRATVFRLYLRNIDENNKKISFITSPELHTTSLLFDTNTNTKGILFNNTKYTVKSNKWNNIIVTCIDNILTIYLNKEKIYQSILPYRLRLNGIDILKVGSGYEEEYKDSSFYIKNLIFINGFGAPYEHTEDKESIIINSDNNFENIINNTSYSYIENSITNNIYIQSRGDKTFHLNFNNENFDTTVLESSGDESKIVNENGVWCFKKALNEFVKIKYRNDIFDWGFEEGVINFNVFVKTLSSYTTIISDIISTGFRIDLSYNNTSVPLISVFLANNSNNTSQLDILNKWVNIHIEKRRKVLYVYLDGILINVYYINKQKLERKAMDHFFIGYGENNSSFNSSEFYLKDVTIIKGRISSKKAIEDFNFKNGISYTSGYDIIKEVDEHIPSYKIDFSKKLYDGINLNYCKIEKYKDKYCLYKPDTASLFAAAHEINNKILDFRTSDFTISFNILITSESFKQFRPTCIVSSNISSFLEIIIDKPSELLKLKMYYYPDRNGSNLCDGYSINSINVDEWNHIFIVKKYNKIQFFINGVADKEFVNDNLLKYVYYLPTEMMFGKSSGVAYLEYRDFRLSDFNIIHKAFNSPEDYLAQYDNIPNGYSYIMINQEGNIEPSSGLIKLTEEEKIDIKKSYNNYYCIVYDHYLNPNHRLYKKDFNTLDNTFSIIHNNILDLKDQRILIEYKDKINIMKKLYPVIFSKGIDKNVKLLTPNIKIEDNSDKTDIKFLLSKDGLEFFGYDNKTETWKKDLEMSEDILESLRSIEFNKLFGSEIYKEELFIKSIFYNNDNVSSELKEINIIFWKNQPPVIDSVVIEPNDIHFEYSTVKVTAKDLEGGKIYLQVQIKKFGEKEYYIADDWKEIKNNITATRAYNEKYFLPGENKIRIYVKDEHNNISYYDGIIILNNKGPIMTYTFNDFSFAMNITDPESDMVQVQVSIDDEVVLPYGEKYNTPFLFKYQWDHKYIKVGEQQIIKVEVKDYFNKITTQNIYVIGRYKGLLYRDIEGNYYTSDRGEILKYLDFKEMIMGQNSIPVPVDLINHSNYPLRGVKIKVDNGNLNENIKVKLSETLEPFNSQDSITITGIFNEDEEKTFYVRVESNPGRGTMNGEFKILSEGGIN